MNLTFIYHPFSVPSNKNSLKRALLKSLPIPLDILDKQFSPFSLEEWKTRPSPSELYRLACDVGLRRKIPSVIVLSSQQIVDYQGQVQTKARETSCTLYVLYFANSSKYMGILVGETGKTPRTSCLLKAL